MLHARVIGGHGRSQEVELFSQMSPEILHRFSVAHAADGVAGVRANTSRLRRDSSRSSPDHASTARTPGRSADERHRMLVRRPLLRLRQSQPRMIPQRMTRPSRLVSRMALLRASRHERPCSIDRVRVVVPRSHRLNGNVVSRLSASSASCATTAITGMLTSTTVMCRNGTPMLPMARLAVITHSRVAAGPSNHEHSSNRDAKEP